MKEKKIIADNKGMSMIIAMIFFMVITLACLTLFHVTSGAIMQSSNYRNAQIADIMASSLSVVVQDQIDNGVETIESGSLSKEEVTFSDGRNLLEANNSLSQYLLTYLANGWTYYNEEIILQSDKSVLTRKFDIEGLENYNDAKGWISMYWTSDFETETGYLQDRKLYVTVTISVNGVESSVTSTFEFVKGSYTFSDGEKKDDAYYWWRYNGEMS